MGQRFQLEHALRTNQFHPFPVLARALLRRVPRGPVGRFPGTAQRGGHNPQPSPEGYCLLEQIPFEFLPLDFPSLSFRR